MILKRIEGHRIVFGGSDQQLKAPHMCAVLATSKHDLAKIAPVLRNIEIH